MSIRSICVYCGSQEGARQAYCEAGRRLGLSMAKHGIKLVYGGGMKGVMGAVARGVLDAGGHVTGVIPRFLVAKESNSEGLKLLSEAILTDDMHQRKHTMFARSDAFVVLPGGIGTLEEIVEIMTWAQLARHDKPMAFANVERFWDPMTALLDHMRTEGFIHTASRVQPMIIDAIDDVVPAIIAAGRKAHDDGNEGVLAHL